MHPIRIQAATFFPDELVIISLVFEHVKEDPVVTFVLRCYVCSLAEEMLAGGRAAYYGVEISGAVAGVDDDGFAEGFPKRVQDIFYERYKVSD